MSRNSEHKFPGVKSYKKPPYFRQWKW